MSNTVQPLIDFTSDVGSVSIAIGILDALSNQVLLLILPTQLVVRKSIGPAPRELD